MLDVIGFGAINLDIIYHVGSLSAISVNGIDLLPGREFSVTSDEFSRILHAVEQRGTLKIRTGGGSAANTVVALSSMGFETGFIGKVGHDLDGEWLRAEMRGVNLQGIVSGGRSGRCLCILDVSQDRSLFLDTNTNDTLSSEEIDYGYATNARYIHLTSFVGEKPFLAQRALVDSVSPPTQISFDPGEVYTSRGSDCLSPFFEKSLVVFVTEREIEMLTGLDFARGSRSLLGMGPSIVVCKRGERGVHVLADDQHFDLPAESTTVTDNTGAGDVFNAGFLAGLLMNRPLRDCARFATRIATRSLTGYGRSRYPERGDLAFLDRPE
jgi:ribokinase